MTTDILKLRPTIRKAAKSVAYNWPGIMEEDDAEQAITLHLLERPNSIQKIVGMERAAQYRAVVGIGHQIASQERANYERYKGSYRYSIREVKGVLSAGALTEEYRRFNDVVLDIKTAIGNLAPQYRKAIYDRYAEGNVPEKGAAAQRLSAALAALVVEMNRVNKRRFMERDDGIGTRRAISNQRAYYITQYEETGDYGLAHNENRSKRQI